jgi:hypothetical protein
MLDLLSDVGMSQEQSEALLDKYPTPAEFFEAMAEREAAPIEANTQMSPTEPQKKKSKKALQLEEPEQYIRTQLHKDYNTRPMNAPTSARLYQLATADDYRRVVTPR